MIDVFKLHWKLIKNPTEEIENSISSWPLPLGISLYIFYLMRNYFQTGDSYRNLRDILTVVYNLESEFTFYLYIILTISFSLIIYYYLMPIFVRLISKQAKNEFNPTPYRKLIFYSPTSYIIFVVYIIMPIQIIVSFYLLFYEAGTFLIVYAIIYGILSMWTLVLLINIFVIQWKGLKIFYNIQGLKTFTLVFLLPVIGFIPMIIIYGQNMINYLKNIIE